MLIPPRGFDGWKVWTVGDDICWMRPGADGRLWAINPEAGYFGVAPGTNYATNPNAMESIKRDTLYTNVALTPDGDVWWEGKDGAPPEELIDWRGRPWTARLDGEGRPPEQPLHGARREQPGPLAARERPQRRADLRDHLRRPALHDGPARPAGVQLDARRLPRRDDGLGDDGGGRGQGRRRAARPDGDAPLLRLRHGRTTSSTGWTWRERSRRLPKIFMVNWFRKGADGKFLWPGFGENMRVLKWIIDRARGRAGASESAIGWVPKWADLPLKDLAVPMEDVEDAQTIDYEEWKKELSDQDAFFEQFKGTMPKEIVYEREIIRSRLSRVTAKK